MACLLDVGTNSPFRGRSGGTRLRTEHEKTALQRQIDATDKEIDQLVYELYGITEEEQKIIEETNV